MSFSPRETHLNVAKVLLGDKGNVHGEEVIWSPCDAEFQAATFVFGINHWQAPLEKVFSAIVAVFTINLSNYRSPHTRPRQSTMS